jgi:hypothetical protein
MHANSLRSHKDTDFEKQDQIVLKAYKVSALPLTDRQVKDGLRLPDMNDVRPVITRLIKRGKLDEVGDVRDPQTKRKVRLVTVKGRMPGRSKKHKIPRHLLMRLYLKTRQFINEDHPRRLERLLSEIRDVLKCIRTDNKAKG